MKNNILNSQKDFGDKIFISEKAYIEKNSLNVHSLKFEDNSNISFSVNFTVFVDSDSTSAQWGGTILCSFSSETILGMMR